MKPRIVQTIGLILALSPAAMAQTGVLDVSWDAGTDPGIVAYRVYYGTSSLDLSEVIEVPAAQTTAQIPDLLPFTFYFVEVAAVRASGCESDRSAQASGRTLNPGPECTAVIPDSSITQGDTNRGLTITGTGFEPGISVRFLRDSLQDLLVIESLAETATTELTLLVSTTAETPAEAISVELKNTDPGQTLVICDDVIDVQFDSARADVDGSGRVDGLDSTLLSIVFGAFLNVCSLDAPSAVGIRCDSEDDCGGTVGVTDFCTDRACNAGSPANVALACNSEDDCGGNVGTSHCVTSPYNPSVDMNTDGLVDGDDASLQSAEWGR